MVLGAQRRACQLALGGGPLLILSTPEVPLAPNALTVDVAPHLTLGDAGFRVGQVVALRASAPADRDADWRVALGEASSWEPRPRVEPVDPRDLGGRLRTTRATVIAEGAGESLLPLLWASESDVLPPGVVRAAGPPTRRLRDAAIQGDPAAVAGAARGLAGLGPGLTPSGDDLLTGFAAAWTLVGESLDLDGAARGRVTVALLAGAQRGASALGLAWLGYAVRGDLLEPMTRFVATLLATESHDLDVVVRGALAVGSSSGTDWMVGFLFGASALLDATIRGRPW